MKLEELRQEAREGINAPKRIRCARCNSVVVVAHDVIAVGMCDRCPENNGWKRVNGGRKCDMQCADPIDYVRIGNEDIGYCGKHAIDLTHAALDMIDGRTFDGVCKYCGGPGKHFRLDGTPGSHEYATLCAECIQSKIPFAIAMVPIAYVACPRCHGIGAINGTDCRHCNGDKRVPYDPGAP